MEQHSNNSLWRNNRGMQGWLSAFLFLTLSSIFMDIRSAIGNFSIDSYSLFELGSFGIYWHYFLSIIDHFFSAFLAAYVIYSFSTFQPNAVFIVKLHLIVLFLLTLCVFLGNIFQENKMENTSSIIVIKFAWCIGWFLYFCFSTQIKELFPKSERKIFKRDKYLIGFIVAFPIIIFIMICITLLRKEMNTKILDDTPIEIILRDGEYFDGKIALMPIDGLHIEQKESEDEEIYFYLFSDDGAGITLLSGYEKEDAALYSFAEYMDNWKDKDLDDYKYEEIDEHYYSTDDNSIRYKILQYDSEPVIYWTFALIFNKKTHKCALISCYSLEDERKYVDELVSAIRFE